MNLVYGLISVSSVSFFIYGFSYFLNPSLKEEFKRFKLENFGLLTAVLEICGSLGSVLGIWFNPLLLFSSTGLATLMLFALIFRIKHRDHFFVCIPALFYLLLNVTILYLSI